MKKDGYHFLHIPKTGGSSLASFLEFQFPLSDICPSYYLHSQPKLSWVKPEHIYENLSSEQLKQYRFYRGHTGWLPKTIPGNNKLKTITFLRHPIEHLLSIYNHIKTAKDDFTFCNNRWASFEDFLNDSVMENYISNIQTQHFCTDYYIKKDQPIEHSFLSDIVGTWCFDLQLTAKERYKLALERLRQCHFVGIQENYEVCFKKLCQQNNWQQPKQVPALNVRQYDLHRNQLAPRIMNRIKELTEFDHLLYQKAYRYAQKKYAKKIQFLKRFTSKISPESVQFKFSDKIIGDGWYSREGDDPVFSWSRPQSSLIFSLKQKTDYHISIHVTHHTLNSLQDIKLVSNNIPIPLTLNPGNILTATLPKACVKNDDSLVLEFTATNVKKTADPRRLAFALHCIEIYAHSAEESLT